MDLAGRSVLVTGGAGFIGAHVVRRLLAGGAAVRVLDDLSAGGAVPEGAQALVGDVCDEATAARAVAGADLVVHMAVKCVRLSLIDPLGIDRVNSRGSLVLARAAAAAAVPRLAYVSSSEVYGSAAAEPMDEAHPTRPSTVYGASKLAGELYAAAAHPAVTIVRPFNAYGPGSHVAGVAGEVIPRFMALIARGDEVPIHGDGAQTRDFTYVEDTARGIVLAAACDALVGAGPINLASEDAVTVRELARRIGQVVGRAPRLAFTRPRPGDLLRQRGSRRLAERLLGYRPEVTLDEGLARTFAWLRSQPIADLPREPWDVA